LFRHTIGAAMIALVVGWVGLVVAAEKPASSVPDGERVLPFKISVADGVLRDLKDRLARTRWPNQVDDTGWEYGIPVVYMKELVQY
jgi:hypothetical protein